MIDSVRQDFLEAIERIKLGKPINEALKLKAIQGKLKLNNSTVALEASRGLSTLHTAKYRDLKTLIAGGRQTANRARQVEELRVECRTMRKNLERSELRLSHVEVSLVQAERALQQAIETKERLADDNKRLRKHIADMGKKV
ncbi:hypothetical protein [Yoonia maritima]|uniref:hypothetical protein n=1 Tax=Yoonia maritima TaxID=1435347 RepID=UPI0013A5F757|nr:hypothetical protein [Yoonia maritima]